MILVRPLQKRVDELKEDIRTLKLECQARDDMNTRRQTQLETMLLLHGPAQMKAALQAALQGDGA